jgi:DNA polymerase-3 subunit epsilon
MKLRLAAAWAINWFARNLGLLHPARLSHELDGHPLTALTYTVLDTETTGLEPSAGDEIISIGAVRIANGILRPGEKFEQLVDPRRPLKEASAKIHGIQAEMLRGQPTIDKVLPDLHRFCDGTVLVAHNAAFDMRFLELKQKSTGVHFTQPVLDTELLSVVLYGNAPSHQIEAVAARLGAQVIGRHTAIGDALTTAELFLRMIPLLVARGIVTLGQARAACEHCHYARRHY